MNVILLYEPDILCPVEVGGGVTLLLLLGGADVRYGLQTMQEEDISYFSLLRKVQYTEERVLLRLTVGVLDTCELIVDAGAVIATRRDCEKSGHIVWTRIFQYKFPKSKF